MVSDPDPESSSSPSTITVRRSTIIVFALAGLAAIVTVVLLVSLIRADSGESSVPQAASGPPGAGSATPAGSALPADAFGPPARDVFGRRVDVPKNPAGQVLPQQASNRKPGDADWLTAAPAGTQAPGGWQRVYGVSVPFSTSDGPARVENGLALGYSHSPQGAALAAAQIWFRSTARPADGKIRSEQMVLTPADQQALDRSNAEGKLPQSLPDSVTKWMLATDAFKVDQYTPDAAVVWLAGRGAGSTWLATRQDMAWVNGDWRWKPPPGFAKAPSETLKTLAGWTKW